MLRTNVEAGDHLCALVAPGMVERRRGAILNVASTASYQPLPGQAGYAASKAFVRSYTTSLAGRSEEHTSELQSLMRISYAVFCLKKKNNKSKHHENTITITENNN